jgi:hypothetical protein
MDKNKETKNKTYSYKTRKEKIRLRIIDTPEDSPVLDGMDSICKSKGEEAVKRADYYDSYDWSATDPEGSYTGIPTDTFGEVPVQDVDDL